MYNPYQQAGYGGPPQYPPQHYGPPQPGYGPAGYNQGPPPNQAFGSGPGYQSHSQGFQHVPPHMSHGQGGWQGYGPEAYQGQPSQMQTQAFGPPQVMNGAHGSNGYLERPPRRPQLSTAPGPTFGRMREPEECYNCGSTGHMAQHCPEPKREVPHGAAKRRSQKSNATPRAASFPMHSPMSPYQSQPPHSAGAFGPPHSPFGNQGPPTGYPHSAGPQFGPTPFGIQSPGMPPTQDYPQPPHSASSMNFSQFPVPAPSNVPRVQGPPSQIRSGESSAPGNSQGAMLNPFSPHPGSHLHGQYGGSIGGPTPSFQYRPHKVVQTVYDPTDDFEIMSKAPIDEFYPETKEPAKSVGRPLRSNVLLSRDNTPSPVHGDHEGETVSKYIYMNGPGASPRSIRNTSTWEKVKTDPAYGIMLDNRKQMSMAELRIRSRERAVPHSRHVSVKPELNGDSRGQHGTNASTPAPVPLRKHDSTKVLLEKLQARGVARITSINGKRVAEDEAEQVKTKAAKIEQESASPEQRKKALTDHVTNGETPKQVLMEKTAAWIQAQNTEPNGLGHDITSAATPSPAPVPDPTPDTAAENVDTEAAAEAANGVVPKNQIVLVETKTAKGRKKNALVKQKEDEEEKQLIKEEAMITRAKAKRKAAAPKVEAAYNRRW